MQIYPRKIEKELLRQLYTREIIVLTGMRRVGKTTLYQYLFDKIESSNKVFLDMENPAEQRVFEEEDYNNIWSNLKEYGIGTNERAYIFLDEIQAFPEIAKPIKYLYDHYPVKFFVTGSSSYYFKNLFPESLAGRKFIFELFPLTFGEFLIFKGKLQNLREKLSDKDSEKNETRYIKNIKLYEEYIQFGGFPGVVLENEIDNKKRRLEDIFKSYFEKDVKSLADFRDVKTFRDLLFLLMQRVGSKIEITRLSSELSVSRETIYSYLSFLEGTYFISLVKPFSRNVDREVSGARKLYLCDTGIANHFSKLSGGQVFENSVFSNLKGYGKINYYQRRSGAEIDFIINEFTGVEAKLKGVDADLLKLGSLSKDVGLKEFYVVTKEFNQKQGFIPAPDL
ncbi:hypothetical protein AUJ94_00490 [bacterium CG2_30_40_12]|nr:MAG: hypothetical protein AUJ94_00490 [bacterium CG2_30_40_12]